MHRNHKPFEKENINSDVTKTILLGLLDRVQEQQIRLELPDVAWTAAAL